MGKTGQEVLTTSLVEFSRHHPTRQDFETCQLTAWEDAPYFDYDDNEVDLPAIAFLTDLLAELGIHLEAGAGAPGFCFSTPAPRPTS